MRYLLPMLFVVLSLALLVGCSGNDRHAGAAHTGSSVRITIVWPTRTRLIPLATQCIVISISDHKNFLTFNTVTRPSTDTTSVLTFAEVPVGNLSIQAQAFPSTNADLGIPLAFGSTTVTTLDGQTASASFTMSSTIDHLNVAGANPLVHASTQFSASAIDASGHVVLTTASQLGWTASNTNAAVDNTGRVTGVQPGTCTITVTDAESKKQGELSITILPSGVLTDLGTLGGMTKAHGVNDAAVVVGESNNLPFIWTASSGMRQLTLPTGFITGCANAINDAGQIAGSVYNGTNTHAVRWDADGTPHDLGTSGRNSYANCIDSNGAIGGSTQGSGRQVACVFTSAGNTITYNYNSYYDCSINAINNQGWCIGTFFHSKERLTQGGSIGPCPPASNRNAGINEGWFLIAPDGTMQVNPASLDPTNSESGYPSGINIAGQVVGAGSSSDYGVVGWLWSKNAGITQIIPGSAGTIADYGVATAINDAGQVAGYLENTVPGAPGVFSAILWTPTTGAMVIASFGKDTQATAINNNGQVVGYGYDTNSTSHAFLWSPSQ